MLARESLRGRHRRSRSHTWRQSDLEMPAVRALFRDMSFGEGRRDPPHRYPDQGKPGNAGPGEGTVLMALCGLQFMHREMPDGRRSGGNDHTSEGGGRRPGEHPEALLRGGQAVHPFGPVIPEHGHDEEVAKGPGTGGAHRPGPNNGAAGPAGQTDPSRGPQA